MTVCKYTFYMKMRTSTVQYLKCNKLTFLRWLLQTIKLTRTRSNKAQIKKRLLKNCRRFVVFILFCTLSRLNYLLASFQYYENVTHLKHFLINSITYNCKYCYLLIVERKNMCFSHSFFFCDRSGKNVKYAASNIPVYNWWK